ncbi:hypothetical protein MRX96_001862 [Rhipicephalus microplus]
MAGRTACLDTNVAATKKGGYQVSCGTIRASAESQWTQLRKRNGSNLTKCDSGTFQLTNRATPTRYQSVKNFRAKVLERLIACRCRDCRDCRNRPNFRAIPATQLLWRSMRKRRASNRLTF